MAMPEWLGHICRESNERKQMEIQVFNHRELIFSFIDELERKASEMKEDIDFLYYALEKQIIENIE